MSKRAAEGDKIEFSKGVKGVVEKVNENSVIVSISENKTSMVYSGNVTVVNHKNYKVL